MYVCLISAMSDELFYFQYWELHVKIFYLHIYGTRFSSFLNFKIIYFFKQLLPFSTKKLKMFSISFIETIKHNLEKYAPFRILSE